MEAIKLPCGCIPGYYHCGEYERLSAIEKGAYHSQNWPTYEEYNRRTWHHLGQKSPFYEKATAEQHDIYIYQMPKKLGGDWAATSNGLIADGFKSQDDAEKWALEQL